MIDPNGEATSAAKPSERNQPNEHVSLKSAIHDFNSPVARSRTARILWQTLGIIAVFLGIIGMILPVMPGVVFLVFALWCFTRSSPRFERWLLNAPVIGNALHEHRQNPGMPVKAKLTAIAMIVVSVTTSSILLRSSVVTIMGVILGVAGALSILWWVPTRAKLGQHQQDETSPDQDDNEFIR